MQSRPTLATRIGRRMRGPVVKGGRPQILLVLALLGIACGIGFWFAGSKAGANLAWGATTLLVLVPLTWSIAGELRHGEFGVDVIALIAMAGSLVLGQELAGAVIGVMLSGGDSLERIAGQRAKRELAALVAHAPTTAHRYEDGKLESPSLEDIRRGDLLLVKPGEVVPVDGVVNKNSATLDESALTGEALTVDRLAGDQVRSGAINAGGPFDMHATTTAAASTYARIVRLVEEAQASKAPFVRMADRYALWFLVLSVSFAGFAWLVSGDPVRALAVMVVATPCPLILAAPVAILAGISRAAHRGVIIKGGAALEALATAQTVIFDKTGTLTAGAPRVASVEAFGDWHASDVLRLAASLDQLSPHVFAGPIVQAARERSLHLEFPTDVEEVPGAGIHGKIGPARIALGKAAWLSGGEFVPAPVMRLREAAEAEGRTVVFVTADGIFAGGLQLEDPLRSDAPRVVRELRAIGIKRVVVLSGDRTDVAEAVGAMVGADVVLAERSPEAKVETVHAESRLARTVMIGDGINDAPALAAAHVGVAMGARGATAASEAADVVIVLDRLERAVDAIAIAGHARSIALQSVIAGMALSGVAMMVAAAGLLPPVAGAILQEIIDVAVILNALRALGGKHGPRVSQPELLAFDRVKHEHAELSPVVTALRRLADESGAMPPARLRNELRAIHRQLVERLLPHEASEGASFYPIVAKTLGGQDPTGVMVREHAEIASYVHDIGRLASMSGQLTPDQLTDLRRELYGLYAIMQLHMAQEDEEYLSLFEDSALGAAPDLRRPSSQGPFGNRQRADAGVKPDSRSDQVGNE